MKRLRNCICALLCLSLLLLPCMTALAAGEGQPPAKDENVFILLHPDGSVKSQTVSCWLHSDNGFDGYADMSRLTGITNIKSDVQPVVDGQLVTWTTEDHDIYYQGEAQEQPPVAVAITYELNGRPVTAEQLLGQSGQVAIHLHLANQAVEQKVIEGQARNVYTPFAVALMVNLPTKCFTDIDAGAAQVLTESTNQVVALVALPGLKENFEGLLDEELAEVKDALQDDFTIVAQADSFQMPDIMMAVAPSIEELQDIQLSSQMTDLMEGMGQLQEASSQLKEGTGLLSQALEQFDSQMGAFKTQYQTFDSGIADALSGAKQVQEGAKSLQGAARLLKAKVTDELIPAMDAAAPLQKQLSDKLGTLEQQLERLDLPDLSGLGDELGAAFSTVCDASFNAAIQVATGDPNGSVAALSQPQQQALAQAKAQILQQVQPQVERMLDGLDMDSLAALKTTLLEIDGLAGQVMGGMGALTQALYQPQDDPSNPKTLANAIIALSTGADSLAAGASDLKEGLGALRGASSQIGNAIDAFDTASGELSTQTGVLDRGMGDFVEEGMSQLDDPERKAEFDKALAVKDEMLAQSQAYTSYSGAQEGVKTHLKLVYKVEAPQAPAAAQGQTADGPQDAQQPTTFWQRILQLFR